jgi:hypothetical protein
LLGFFPPTAKADQSNEGPINSLPDYCCPALPKKPVTGKSDSRNQFPLIHVAWLLFVTLV